MGDALRYHIPPATTPRAAHLVLGGRPLPIAGTLRVWTCGITPYDVTHVGHAATFLWTDLIVSLAHKLGVRTQSSRNVTDIDDVLNGALFTVDYNEMVIVRDIDFYSLCEHHLLPFFGKCHVAYVPNGKVIGLSKVPRLVDMFARRLQLQERMTNQIAETIRETIQPLGVAVVCEGTHLCMAMRGVEKQQSTTVTSAMLGAFRNDARTRGEFLQLIKTR